MDHQKSGEKIENKVVEKKIKVGMCRRFAKRRRLSKCFITR